MGRLSNLICIEHGLSVIQSPRRYTHPTYDKWIGDKKQPSHRDVLRAAIDDALARKPETFEALLQLVRESGYRVSVGKNITFRRDGQRAIRLHTLGAGYSEAELRGVIAGKSDAQSARQTRAREPARGPTGQARSGQGRRL